MASIVAGPRKFVLTCAGQNNNKFWEIVAMDDGTVTATYGRVGAANPQSKTWNGDIDLMESKIHKKTRPNNKKYGEGNCYTEVKVVGGVTGSNDRIKGASVNATAVKQLAQDQITYKDPETGKLIGWLADVNRHQIAAATKGAITYNVDSGMFQTPLGILEPSAITEARSLLVTLGDFVAKGNLNKPYIRALEAYMRLIPTDIGMKRGWEETFLVDLPAVQKQGQILDALDASYIDLVSAQNTAAAPKDAPTQPKVFDVKLELTKDKKIWALIERLFNGTRNRMHSRVYGMTIRRIWRVEIASEKMTWAVAEPKFGNVRDDLWHGTGAANLLSILKGGLIIPPRTSSHVTGRMFGNGVYASDQSTKALNYATGFWGGQDAGRYFMFHVRFAMGKMHLPNRFGTGDPPRGYDSTFAKAGTSIRNNEMIVYSTNQVQLLELVEFND